MGFFPLLNTALKMLLPSQSPYLTITVTQDYCHEYQNKHYDLYEFQVMRSRVALVLANEWIS